MLDGFWKWPNGWVWRVTRGMTEASRRTRFDLFMREMKPTSTDTVLDIGAGEGEGRAVNFFEEWYPWRANVTAVALSDLPVFRNTYPEVKLVVGDGRSLPFPDNTFDLVFTNAVIEHVGTEADQRRFVAEACRVARRVFLSMPNRWFPIDAHTMIPFAHWLPMKMRNAIYRALGRTYFADEKMLRLLGASDLKKMIPSGWKIRLVRQRTLGFTANLNAVLERI